MTKRNHCQQIKQVPVPAESGLASLTIPPTLLTIPMLQCLLSTNRPGQCAMNAAPSLTSRNDQIECDYHHVT